VMLKQEWRIHYSCYNLIHASNTYTVIPKKPPQYSSFLGWDAQHTLWWIGNLTLGSSHNSKASHSLHTCQ
jgi:hypothetical protein